MSLSERKTVSMRKQDELQTSMLQYRLENLLPKLLKETGIDMWLVMGYEFNEDPVLRSLIPPMVKVAPKLTLLVFNINPEDGSCEFCNCGKNDMHLDRLYTKIYDRASDESEWHRLRRYIEEKKPKTIGINVMNSYGFGHCDGLLKGQYDQLMAALGGEYGKRVVSAEELCIRWLETRTPQELGRYRTIYPLVCKCIEEAFSPNVVTPGETTTNDVEWFFMEEFSRLGLTCWFPPNCDIQRQGLRQLRTFDEIIMPGDLLHCDVGFVYFGLYTDTQRMVYIPKPGEAKVPDGIMQAFRNTNRLQDIVRENFIVGKTGNEILKKSLQDARAEGLTPHIYTHPIGFHGHGAGCSLGLWDREYVPGEGDWPLYDNTCYALELNTITPVPEWDNQPVRIMLEETVAFSGGKVEFLAPGRDILPVFAG